VSGAPVTREASEVVYETERLRLEPLRASHAPEMFGMLSDPRLYRFVPRDPPPSLESLTARFRTLETRASPAGDEIWLNWVAREKAGNACLGRVEATVRRDRSAYLAYEIAAERWGAGFATEACRRIVTALFDDHGVDRITAEVDTRNAASIRLLERLGFRRGALKQNADHFKGANSDELTFDLTRPATR
jgi:ribosomal-protein-alanine N-acetyltransferase